MILDKAIKDTAKTNEAISNRYTGVTYNEDTDTIVINISFYYIPDSSVYDIPQEMKDTMASFYATMTEAVEPLCSTPIVVAISELSEYVWLFNGDSIYDCNTEETVMFEKGA